MPVDEAHGEARIGRPARLSILLAASSNAPSTRRRSRGSVGTRSASRAEGEALLNGHVPPPPQELCTLGAFHVVGEPAGGGLPVATVTSG